MGGKRKEKREGVGGGGRGVTCSNHDTCSCNDTLLPTFVHVLKEKEKTISQHPELELELEIQVLIIAMVQVIIVPKQPSCIYTLLIVK